MIDVSDLDNPLSEKDYPILTTLMNKGINGLGDIVLKEYGFKPETNYISKCHLCLSICKYLKIDLKIPTKDLQVKKFYEQV